jgi:hypothetical protein
VKNFFDECILLASEILGGEELKNHQILIVKSLLFVAFNIFMIEIVGSFHAAFRNIFWIMFTAYLIDLKQADCTIVLLQMLFL